MKKTVEEINKMIMEDAPMEEINDAIGYIDICSCFDPIFEPPIDFLEECRKRWEAAQSSFCKTIECKISRSFFADSSYMLSFSVLCSCVCSRLISPSVSSWHKQDNTLMHQSPGHIQRRTPYNF